MKIKNNKLYIACDMEGTAGNCNWDEVNQETAVYSQFQELMTEEVLKICNIASNYFKEIYIKDGHWTETNILLKNLPSNCFIIRGNDGRNLTGLDETFDAVMLVGYHAAGGEFQYPLSHTITDDIVYEVRLNGQRIGETTLAIFDAKKLNVPVIFVSGDDKAVIEAKRLLPNLPSVTTKKLSNTAYLCKSPQKIYEELDDTLAKFINNLSNENIELCKIPSKFELEIEYTAYRFAKKYSDYPNSILDAKTVKYFPKDLDEFLRIINLCI